MCIFFKKNTINFEQNINFIRSILFIVLSTSLGNNFHLLTIEKKLF